MFETNYSETPFKFELIPIKLRSVSFQKLGNKLIDNISFSINSKERFYTEIKNYWNEIDEYDLQEDYVGIRPKIQSTNQNFADFSILTSDHHSCSGLVFLQGIESPGLTCSMAIAEYILKKLDL